MKTLLKNTVKLIVAAVFVVSVSVPLQSCASSHGESVGSSGHIGNPHDKNHHVWGKRK